MSTKASSDSIRLMALVDKEDDWHATLPDIPRVTVNDYLRKSRYRDRKGLKLLNLCNSYRYLGTGYYASLLAEARGHRVMPDVATITGLASAALPRLDTAWLEQRLQTQLADEPSDKLRLLIAFGRCSDTRAGGFARHLFESLACPLLRVELRREGHWRIHRIRPAGLRSLDEPEQTFVGQAMGEWLGRRWHRPRHPDSYRYDMAILVDPDEAMPPSDDAALRHFVRAGNKLGMQVEYIRKKDFGRLAEFDALFIRATTRIDHYTYRFARKAALEGIVVIDDPQSILRCTNKVYLAELLTAHKVSQPKTCVINKDDWRDAPATLGWPVVLKVPDGAFSTGVFKAENAEEYARICKRLFHDSDLLLAQSWLYTAFDWRVGILDGKPLYACQYFMSEDHWQIYNHDGDKGFSEGDSRTLTVEDAPAAVIETAVRAAAPIGNGLYGVDLKQNDEGVFVIEINDNPNIDHGVEDVCLGQALYDQIMEQFLQRIVARHHGKGRRT